MKPFQQGNNVSHLCNSGYGCNRRDLGIVSRVVVFHSSIVFWRYSFDQISVPVTHVILSRSDSVCRSSSRLVG